MTRLGVATLLVGLLAGPLTGAAAEPAFRLHQPLDRSWSVAATQVHPEYVRLHLAGLEGRTACVEIRQWRRGDPEQWSSHNFRVQPCPGTEISDDLAKLVLARLRQADRAPRVVPPELVERGWLDWLDEIEWADWPRLAYPALNFLALLLGLSLALAGPLRDRRLLAATVLGLAALAAGLVLWLVPVEAVPAGWVTVLHEGYGYQNIMQLNGSGVHAGPNFYVLQDLWTGRGAWYSGAITLRAVVRVNIALAVFNLAGFFLCCWVVSRRAWLAALLTLLAAGNLNFLHGIFSETPAQLLLAYYLLATPAAWWLARRKSRRSQVTALVQLLVAGLLLVTTRQDMVVLVVPAAAAGLMLALGWDGPLTDLLRRAWEWCRTHWRRLLPVVLVIAVASTIAWLSFPVGGDPRLGWAVDGLFPFNPSFLTPPRFLAEYLPAGLVLLVVAGIVAACRRPLRALLLPISLLVLWRVYYSATHGWGGPFYERFRFLVYVQPLFLLLAALGLDELDRWRRRLPGLRRSPRLSACLLAASFLVFHPLGWSGYFTARQQLPGLHTPAWLLSRNQQTEVRYLLDLMERYPRCAFITKTMRHDNQGHYRHLWGVFGKRIRTNLVAAGGKDLFELSTELGAGAGCRLFYHGLDCNKQRSDGCNVETAGRELVEQRVFPSLPYTDFHGGDGYPAQIHLSVYRLP